MNKRDLEQMPIMVNFTPHNTSKSWKAPRAELIQDKQKDKSIDTNNPWPDNEISDLTTHQ